jgi:hypothetical protein
VASHGNSLRQLLESHTAVKVKVNTQMYGNNLQAASEHIRDLAVASDAPAELELLQVRESEKIILFGMPSTLDAILSGEFPPEPVVWQGRVAKQQDDNDSQ